MIKFGLEWFRFTLLLASDGDFVTRIIAPIDWPSDTRIDFELSSSTTDLATWPATITGAEASWTIPAAEVNTLIVAKVSRAQLAYYPPAGGRLVWGRGDVHVD